MVRKTSKDLYRLTDLYPGEEGEIEYLDGGRGLRGKLYSMNIRPGKKIRVESSFPFHGPIVVEMDRSTYTIGRGIANKIIVDYNETDKES